MPADNEESQRPRGVIPAEDREAFKKRSAELGQRLDTVSARKVARPNETAAGGKAYGLAFRFMIDLLAGIGLGVGIGWLLDWWLNTLPLFLVLFMLLGFAAGLRSVIQAANKQQAKVSVAKDATRVEDEKIKKRD